MKGSDTWVMCWRRDCVGWVLSRSEEGDIDESDVEAVGERCVRSDLPGHACGPLAVPEASWSSMWLSRRAYGLLVAPVARPPHLWPCFGLCQRSLIPFGVGMDRHMRMVDWTPLD